MEGGREGKEGRKSAQNHSRLAYHLKIARDSAVLIAIGLQ